MMIHELPVPMRGNTHSRITRKVDHLGSSTILHYQLGGVAEGAFQPDALIPEVRLIVPRPEMDVVREAARKKGAPATAGEQEYRVSDLLAYLDADIKRWEPRI